MRNFIIKIVPAVFIAASILVFPAKLYSDRHLDTLSLAQMILKGDFVVFDIHQDIYGLKAMFLKQDPYRDLGPALKTFGLDYTARHPSPHPPTAFLLTFPVVFLPIKISAMVWAWLMLFIFAIGLLIYGYKTGDVILICALSLLWPTTVTSLVQLTIIWLTCILAAYKFRNTRPLISGIFIGLASLSKFSPAVLLIPFLLRRKWRAVAGFLIVWVIAALLILAFAPETIMRYLEVAKQTSVQMMLRTDNASPGAFLGLYFETAGWIAAGGLGMLFLYLTRKIWLKIPHGNMAANEWNFYSYLAVIVLPVTWSYSILPLFPILAMTFQKGGRGKYLAVLTLAVAILMPAFGTITPYYVFILVLLFGVMIIIREQPNIINRFPGSRTAWLKEKHLRILPKTGRVYPDTGQFRHGGYPGQNRVP